MQNRSRCGFVEASLRRHGIISVSYTHLDVYKRQPPPRPAPDAAAFSKTCGRQPSARTLRFSFSYTRVRIHSSEEASTASSSMNQRTPLFSSGFARSASPASVSYTHLDVYKRQGLERGDLDWRNIVNPNR